MNIIVVDGETMNPGDLSWDGLLNLGNCEIYDCSTYEENLERSKNADIVLTNKVVFDERTFQALPKLKMISVTATGYNVINIDSARKHNVIVCNVPTYGTKSVAQMVFAHLLELCHHVGYHSETVHNGKWCKSSSFCYWDRPLTELDGLTMGIIGIGRIGLATAKLAQAFGMNVIAHDIINPPKEMNIRMVDIEMLFRDSDVISLHCPLKPETKKIINQDTITLMKKSAFVINTSRGQLIDEDVLAEALNNERIAGAGLDVLSTEPARDDNPLLKAKNCYITPHIAWATKSARNRLLNITIENVKAYINNKPRNIVS